MAKPQYSVVAAYVTVKTNTSEGPRLVGLYEGSPWPADASEEATEHHLENHLIAEVGKEHEAATPEALATPIPAAQVPGEPVGEPGGPKPARVASGRQGGGTRA